MLGAADGVEDVGGLAQSLDGCSRHAPLSKFLAEALTVPRPTLPREPKSSMPVKEHRVCFAFSGHLNGDGTVDLCDGYKTIILVRVELCEKMSDCGKLHARSGIAASAIRQKHHLRE